MSSLPLHINVEQRLQECSEPWAPIDIVRFNDQVTRLAKFRGAYHWHTHNDDELFQVYRGTITIHFRGRKDLVLHEGEMGMVPKGVEHCPESPEDSYVLMIEPAHTESTGSGRQVR